MKKLERWRKKKKYNFNKQCTVCKTKSIRPKYKKNKKPKFICETCKMEV